MDDEHERAGEEEDGCEDADEDEDEDMNPENEAEDEYVPSTRPSSASRQDDLPSRPSLQVRVVPCGREDCLRR